MSTTGALSADRPADDRTIAVLPLGAHEYHGPHLPFETDTIIAAGIADRLASAVPAGIDLRVLPVEPVGYSVEHMNVAGSRTLAFDEAAARWIGIAGALSEHGIRRLLLLNAHGGNSPLLTIVATEARARFSMLCVATAWTRFGQPEGWMAPEAKAIDIHGGDIETSVMLALAPERVDRTKALDFGSRQSRFAADFTHLRAYGPHAFGWLMSDLNPLGAAGNAANASAARGEALIAHAVAGLAGLIADMAAFDLALFADQPVK